MGMLYALYDGKDKSKGAFPVSKTEADRLNQMGYGIFLSVNDFYGSRRNEENLKKLNSWFVDVDGVDKKQFEEKIKGFLLPSAIVETKSGFHIYWKCSEDLFDKFGKLEATKQYNKTLDKLIALFDGDKNAKGTTRILRMPNYLHLKDQNNPFMVKVIFESDMEYTHDQINMFLPESKKITVQPSGAVPSGDDFWEKVSSLDCVYALGVVSGVPELNGDDVDFIDSFGSKKIITVNGERVSGCWIDHDGMIGSFSKGGPTIANWVRWYGYEWSEVAEILKKYFPELSDSDDSWIEGFLSGHIS